jgi:hypothetical protein
MKETLNTVRRSFDFVLIDSPPVIAVSDAVVLGTVCDGVILIFNGRQTTAAWARQAVGRLYAVRAPVLGAILNNVDLNNPDFAYYHYYYGPGRHHPENCVQGSSVQGEEPELESKCEDQDPEIVPQEFLNQMTDVLTEVAGPMAPVIMRDKIALLGKSRGMFPTNRLRDLLSSVCKEIANEDLRCSFDNNMSAKIRDLESRIQQTVQRVNINQTES